MVPSGWKQHGSFLIHFSALMSLSQMAMNTIFSLPATLILFYEFIKLTTILNLFVHLYINYISPRQNVNSTKGRELVCLVHNLK